MSTESSNESDISESWSLIDINLNEESLITADSSFVTEQNHSAGLSNIKSRKNVESCNKAKGKHDDNEEDDDADDERNDSGDGESIEILDMDLNYQDSEIDGLDVSGIEHVNFATYHSDDEEGRVNCESKDGTGSTVITRKRRKTSRDLQDNVHCVYSENAMCDTEERHEEFSKTDNHPVYKHYRNNVANTVLSLSVGVIFAGVACVAIGHFLGVQDSAETTVQLVETLKKLQVENAALQSTMVHLKKAIYTLETNSKLKLPTNQPYNKVFWNETPKILPSNTERQAGLNNAPFSEICSSLNSIEWLSKLNNGAKKGTETENREMIINGLGKHIHDQLNLLKEMKSKGTDFSVDTDLLLVLKKLLVVLKKIMNRLSSSPENIGVNERLSKLKYKINHNLKLLRVPPRQREGRAPVTELDLKTIHWTPSDEIHRENPEARFLYKFPQPEKYYYLETLLKQRSSNNSLKNVDYEDGRNKKKSKESDLKDEKLQKKIRKKLNKAKSKKNKKEKHAIGEKSEKRGSEYPKYNFHRFNDSDSPYKKKQEKSTKYKRRVKKEKKSKLKKVLLSKLKEESNLNRYVPFCSESQCFNLTGYWVFKWADGREAFRRHQTLSDWQFDRAKARKDVRNMEMNKNWQFERAKARKELREEGFGGNWAFDNRKHYNGKSSDYSGKKFFQERFRDFE